MSHLDASTLATYNSLIDPHLQCYFSNERIRSHLRHAGLISRRGEIVPESEYRSRLAEREHRKHVRQMLAENIVHRAIDMERTRQSELRRQFEMVAKAALVNNIKESRRRGPFPSGGMSASADMGLISASASWSQSRPKSANVNRDFEVMNDEFVEQPRIPRVQSAHTVGHEQPSKQLSKSPRRRHAHPRRLHRPTSSNPINRSSPLQRPHSSGKYSDSSPSAPSCQITMIYYGPHTKVDYDHTVFEPVDEVMVMQQHCGGENLIVYKGTHKAGDRFAFNSRRHADYPFGLSLYVKGLIDSRISTCCEYKHRHGVRLGGERGHFGIVSVEGSKACLKCRFEKQARLKKYAESPKETSAERQKPITISIPVSDEPKGKQSPVKIPVRSSPSANDNYTEDFVESDSSEKQQKPSVKKEKEKVSPKGGYTSDTDTITSRGKERPVKPRESSSKVPPAPAARRVSKARTKSSSSSTTNDDSPKTKTWQVIFHTSRSTPNDSQSQQKSRSTIDGHLKISFLGVNRRDETESYNIDLHDSSANLKPGQKASFAVKLRPIGEPKQIRLKFEPSKNNDETKWHLHHIEIIDPETQKHTNFACNAFIQPSIEKILEVATEEKSVKRRTAKSSSDSSSSPSPRPRQKQSSPPPIQNRRTSSSTSASETSKRQIPIEQLANTTHDATLNNGSDESIKLASDRNSLHQSDNDEDQFQQRQNRKSSANVRKKSMDEGHKIRYRVAIFPSTDHDGVFHVEEDSRIFVRVNDEGNRMDLQQKNQPKLTEFKPGQSQTFEVNLTQLTQGQPTKLTIGYRNSHITASKWNIDKVVITNVETGEETIFHCDGYLERNDHNHTAEKTLQAAAATRRSTKSSSDEDLTIRNNVQEKKARPSSKDSDAESNHQETPKTPITPARPPSAQVRQQPTTTTSTPERKQSVPGKEPSSSPSFKSMKDEEANYRTIFKQLDPDNEYDLGSERTTPVHMPTPPRSEAPSSRPRTQRGRQDTITTDTQQERRPSETQNKPEVWRPASATGKNEPVEPLANLEDLAGQTARSTDQQNKSPPPATTNSANDHFKNWYKNDEDEDDD